jgi:hypothetical protein
MPFITNEFAHSPREYVIIAPLGQREPWFRASLARDSLGSVMGLKTGGGDGSSRVEEQTDRA